MFLPISKTVHSGSSRIAAIVTNVPSAFIFSAPKSHPGAVRGAVTVRVVGLHCPAHAGGGGAAGQCAAVLGHADVHRRPAGVEPSLPFQRKVGGAVIVKVGIAVGIDQFAIGVELLNAFAGIVVGQAHRHGKGHCCFGFGRTNLQQQSQPACRGCSNQSSAASSVQTSPKWARSI